MASLPETLTHATGFGSDDALYLDQDPLDQEATCAGIPYLVSRGVFVSPENPCTFILTTNAPDGADITVNYTGYDYLHNLAPDQHEYGKLGATTHARVHSCPIGYGLAPSVPGLREQASRVS